MEGSETTLATGDAAATPEVTETSAPAFDTSAFNERFDQFDNTLHQLTETVSAFATPEEEPEPDNWLVDGFGQPEIDAEAEQAQALARLQGSFDSRIDTRLQDAIDQAVKPLQEKLSTFERNAAIDELQMEYPELAQDEQAASALVTRAEQFAQQLGVDHTDPTVLRTVYLAMRGEAAAQSEVPAGQSPGTILETGSGALPPSQEGHPGDAIVNASGSYGGLYS
jgi:hypothetical protein